MVAKKQGTKRLTPATLAASARGIWSSNPVTETVEIKTSVPLRIFTSWSSEPTRSAATTLTPFFLSSSTSGFPKEAGRVKAVIF